jgi:hypothetical protein
VLQTGAESEGFNRPRSLLSGQPKAESVDEFMLVMTAKQRRNEDKQNRRERSVWSVCCIFIQKLSLFLSTNFAANVHM